MDLLQLLKGDLVLSQPEDIRFDPLSDRCLKGKQVFLRALSDKELARRVSGFSHAGGSFPTSLADPFSRQPPPRRSGV